MNTSFVLESAAGPRRARVHYLPMSISSIAIPNMAQHRVVGIPVYDLHAK
jgi:hypothetical protein